MSTERDAKVAKLQLQTAGESLMWVAGCIAIPWLKVKTAAKTDDKVKTYAIGADGVVTVNPQWFASQRPDERVFELATSMMTFLLRHHDRGVDLGVVNAETGGPMPGQEQNYAVWNRARSMVVNKPCHDDAIGRAPADALMPPNGYKGTLDAESLYYWLLANEPPPPPGGDEGQSPDGGGDEGQPQPSPHAGGPVQPPQAPQKGDGEDDAEDGSPGEGEGSKPGGSGSQMSADDIDQLRREVEAMARQEAQIAGRESHLADALKPKRVRTNYRNVIPAGLDVANTEASERTQTTYARAARREALMPEVILPGYQGTDPSVCIVIDFSGSTGIFAQKFVDHAQKVATDFPNTKILLVTHTDRVTYKAWLKPGGDAAKLEESSKFSGGTDFAPAYVTAKEEAARLPGGKFDSVVHFTDGYNIGNKWPMPPCRRFVVGLCGSGEGITPLPMVTKVIPVTMG